MSREVYTYIDLRYLDQYPYWNEIKEYPILSVSADLRKSLKGTMEFDKVEGLFKDDKSVKVVEFRKFSDQILPAWTRDDVKFQETVVLSQFFREKMQKYGKNHPKYNWLIGCRRNISMLLSAIILLEEAYISPDDIYPNGDENIELMLEAWTYLRQHNTTISNYHKILDGLKDREAWNPIFRNCFATTSVDTIVMLGFYYFTPLQEHIMNLLEAAGIRLIFLFGYDEKYSYANEIWEKSYSVENGYVPKSEWHIERTNEIEPIGEIFEGRKAELTNRLEMKEYNSVIDFVHEIKQIKDKGYTLYSSNSNVANDILMDFYPNEYGERKLLSYPIGQFISTLNKMWDEDEQDIILDEESLIECFSSGWLAIHGVSGKQYMEDLVNLLPFFKDCDKIPKWKERIALLRSIKQTSKEVFCKDLSVDDSVARWQEIMGNPLLNFGAFAIEDEIFDVILALIEQLLSMAGELFGKNQSIRIQDHLQKLDGILRQHEMSNELYEEERELVQDIFTKLNDASGYMAECFPADISSALSLYMSGKFNDEEIQSNKIGMVSPIYMVDAACIKHKGKIHICFCDSQNMPGKKKNYVWPLTERVITDCYNRTNNSLITNMMHIMDSSHISNRYFMYAALKNADVQVSWISHIGEDDLAPSCYVQLVSEATGVEIKPAGIKYITGKKIEETIGACARTYEYDINRMPMNTAKEARMDYAICPMKYALGYVVEKYPTFQSEFHQSYAINGLIVGIYNLMKQKGMSIDEIYRNVIELFPALRDVEKRQIYDYMQYENGFDSALEQDMTFFEDMCYTEERLKVRFPNRGVRDYALASFGKLLSPDGTKGMNFYERLSDDATHKGKVPDVCLFCQHQGYCRLASFVVDQEELYD